MKKICPILNKDCLYHECGFFLDSPFAQCCSLVAIASHIEDIGVDNILEQRKVRAKNG